MNYPYLIQIQYIFLKFLITLISVSYIITIAIVVVVVVEFVVINSSDSGCVVLVVSIITFYH